MIFFVSDVWAQDPTANGATLRASADDDFVRVEIRCDSVDVPNDVGSTPKRVSLVRSLPFEYYPTTDFLVRFDGVGNDCENDGYDVDRRYYDPQNGAAFVEISDVRAALAACESSSTLSIERFSDAEIDRGWDKIFDKFYLVADALIDETTGLARGGRILSEPTHCVEFPSENDEARIERKSIKGLEVFDVADAKELGVAHAAITIDLCWLLQTENVPTVEFRVGPKSFYFNKDAVDKYDAFVRETTAAEMETTFVLVFWGNRRHLAPPGTIHPDYEIWREGPGTLSIAAPNLTTFEGVERWRALFEFLGARYVRRDRKFGFVSNYVVGNELNSGYIWDNRGRLPLDETVRQYERGLRIAATALRKYWANANVLAPFDNYWNVDSATEFQQFDCVRRGGFSGKEYLTALAERTRAEGDFAWSVAYHPYGLDLRTPIYWDKYSIEQAPKDENAPRLTPWNIEVLPRFLARSEMRFNDKPRDFYFTEQGFASPNDDNYGAYDDSKYDPNAIPEYWLRRQAAAFAFAHYKFVAIGAKANIFHRHFDVRSELLDIGLWARPKGEETGKGARKPIWYLFQKIDGPDSLTASAPYLSELIFYPQTESATSWNELIPNFDAVRATFETR